MNRQASETVLAAVFIQKGTRRPHNLPDMIRQADVQMGSRTKKTQSKLIMQRRASKEEFIKRPNSHSHSKSKSNRKEPLKKNASSKVIKNDCGSSMLKKNLKQSLFSPLQESKKSRKNIDSIDRLLLRSIRDFSKEKQRHEQQQKHLRQSRTKIQQSMKYMNTYIREQNNKRYVKEKVDVSSRLPWGANEQRITKYAVDTIEKLKKLSQPSSKSKSKHKKRNRRELGLEFLDGLAEKQVRELVEKSRRQTQESRMSSASSKTSQYTPTKAKFSTKDIQELQIRHLRFETEPVRQAQQDRVKNISLKSLLEIPKSVRSSRPRR